MIAPECHIPRQFNLPQETYHSLASLLLRRFIQPVYHRQPYLSHVVLRQPHAFLCWTPVINKVSHPRHCLPNVLVR